MENNNKFEYTYSAKQQTELENIRKKYLPQEESKMDRLRRLDKSAEQKGTIVSIIVGIVSKLIMGTGMCCVLEWEMYEIGIVVGIIGIIGVILAYPLYQYVTKKQREKIAPEILRLTEEISNEK